MDDLKIPLKNDERKGGFHSYTTGPRPTPIRKSLPIYYSLRGKMCHRVRSGHLRIELWNAVYRNGDWHSEGQKNQGHISFNLWCGQTGRHDKFGRLAAVPPEGWPLCGTCEGRAVGAGYPGIAILQQRYELLYTPREGRAEQPDQKSATA